MKKLALAFAAVLLFSGFAATASDKPQNPSGLPIPRFVSLKAEEVNARSGPGTNYPIKWVYNRKFLPVEVVAEFGNWRKIKDADGEEGWVLQSLLSGKRSGIIKSETSAYANPSSEKITMRLGKNVQVELKECSAEACEVIYEENSGWVARSKIWGIYSGEVFD